MFINRKKSTQNKVMGFTLIELVVSIVVIGILTSIAVVSYPGIKKQMTISQMNADLRTAATQLSRDFAKNGKYPDTKEESGDGKGLTAATGTVLTYKYNAGANTYCLAATNGNIVYHIDAKTKSVSTGACSDVESFSIAWGGGTYDYLFDLKQTSDGGYIIGGNTRSFGAAGIYDAYIAKLNSNGDVSWSKTWGDGNDENVREVIQTSDGGYAAVGTVNASDAFFAKFDSDGNSVWTKGWQRSIDEEARGLVQLDDGSFVVFSQNISDRIYLAKFDLAGNLIWNRTYDDSVTHQIRRMSKLIKTSDGGYLMVGSAVRDLQLDSILIKLDSTGGLSWTKTWGAAGADTGFSAIQSSDGSYVVTGYTQSFGAGSYDVYLAKFSQKGELIWNKTWGGVDGDIGYDVTQISSGDYIVVGSTENFGASVDYSEGFVLRFDPGGNLIWNKIWSGSSDYAIVSNVSDGGFVAAGGTSYGAGDDDVVITKYKFDGTINNCPVVECKTPSATITTPVATIMNTPVKTITESVTINPLSLSLVSRIATKTVIIAPL